MFIYVKQFDIQKIDTTFTLSNVNLEISDWVWRENERGFVWLHVIGRGEGLLDCQTFIVVQIPRWRGRWRWGRRSCVGLEGAGAGGTYDLIGTNESGHMCHVKTD